MVSDQIHYAGQIVAVVLAETYEAAREAANRMTVGYAEGVPSATFDSKGTVEQPLETELAGFEDPCIGDFDAAYAAGACPDELLLLDPDTAPQPDRTFHGYLCLERGHTHGL